MILTFEGHTPDIEQACFVAKNATVCGEVTCGKDSSIWFGAAVRGDIAPITIGDGSNIQDNCTLHGDMNYPVVIGKNVTVGHNAVVHGCTLGDNVLIGMGATVLNGAVIGKNCIIGAGALVTENMVIPENTLVVGVPAKPKAELDAKRTSMNLMNAMYYVMEAKKYAKAVAQAGDGE